MPMNYGNVDGWFLGVLLKGKSSDWLQDMQLDEAYANTYEDL